MKLFILLFSLCFILDADVSIQDAWQMVRNKSDALSASKDDVLRSKLKSSSAKSMYLPSISVTGSYTHLDKPFDIDTGKAKSF